MNEPRKLAIFRADPQARANWETLVMGLELHFREHGLAPRAGYWYALDLASGEASRVVARRDEWGVWIHFAFGQHISEIVTAPPDVVARDATVPAGRIIGWDHLAGVPR